MPPRVINVMVATEEGGGDGHSHSGDGDNEAESEDNEMAMAVADDGVDGGSGGAGVAAVVVAVAAMIDADGAFDTDDCHHGNGNASLRPDRTSESLNSFHWLSDDFGQGRIVPENPS